MIHSIEGVKSKRSSTSGNGTTRGGETGDGADREDGLQDEEEESGEWTEEAEVEIMGSRTVRIGRVRCEWTYGFLGAGFDLTKQAWPNVRQVFSYHGGGITNGDRAHPNRVSRATKLHSVADVWVVDQLPWRELEEWMQNAPIPDTVVWFQPADSLVHSSRRHEMTASRKTMQRNGFHMSYTSAHGTHVGSAVNQRVLVVYYWKGEVGGPLFLETRGNIPRPMENLLLPTGIPGNAWFRGRPEVITAVEDGKRYYPCQVQTSVGTEPVYQTSGPMPHHMGAWVETDKGIRRLQEVEFRKGKGIGADTRGSNKATMATTGIHILTAALDGILHWRVTRESEGESDSDVEVRSTSRCDDTRKSESETTHIEDWEWIIPDLTPGGVWYEQRVENLKKAIRNSEENFTGDERNQVYNEGLRQLEIHRGNYTELGPVELQILWWEFPPSVWAEVRNGSSMNWLTTPPDLITKNALMDTNEKIIATSFVDELKQLGVLKTARGPLRGITPLFCVPKPGSAGEFRVIADMRSGGQNQWSGKDPVFLPRISDILNSLYPGGFSAIADASKHFHNFSTLPSERAHMGVIHPSTGEKLWWEGLPMGSTNSPSIACRLTGCLIRKLRERCKLFQGQVHENTWRTSMNSRQYEVGWGHGRVKIRENGEPVVHIWCFVDDFLIHGPTYKSCGEGFNAFLDICVECGVICQKRKTKPPANIQKFCGFQLDTRGNPCIRVTQEKQTRVCAAVRFALDQHHHNGLSGLALASVIGMCQSLVEATPQRIGQTYLRKLYDALHRIEDDEEREGTYVGSP
jgi:Reverse transcriptase (RNA-dependent DNA polymerase)